jgi:hypothetical protein
MWTRTGHGATSRPQARRQRLRIAILLASLFLLIEVGLRSLLGNFGITSLFEYGPSDGRCAALKPGAETDYTGWLFRIAPVHLAVNPDGYRGPRRPKAKAGDSYRILLIGDSYAFGQAVPERATISAQLEGLLRDCGTRRVEVLNFGVPGLNVEEILDLYRRFASQWTHDLVLYVAVENDLDGPLCRAHRSYGILDSEFFQDLNQNVYTSRLVYIAFMLAATGNEESDPSVLDRLRAAEEGLIREARRSGAKLGILELGDPLLKQLPGGRPWSPGVPVLDVSYLRESPHVVQGEFHLDEVGNRILAADAATWIRTHFCGGPDSARLEPRS